ncbi:RNA-guided endonuclease InsQ/TnpB family protein [Candidatus Arsenophonus triatominarum]|uniref:RNA-guided endonuclease InsQ/TnpB family protein n=1 Tax=Candidatus Arsenophonus triatominarum TaxID=57911 RepID=UPI0007C49E9D|nr:helix-turn-helix domain-containing protein [Candidatus Arsenophonus triatominarum]
MCAAKYRIYPDKNQKELLEQHFGHVRHIYNWALSEKKKHCEETGKSLSKRELQDRMVASKKSEKPWLNDINSQSLLAALSNLNTAFSNFFNKRAKFPKFKKKYASEQSFQCPQHVTLDVQNGVINLPKIKLIKAVIHRVIDEGKNKNGYNKNHHQESITQASYYSMMVLCHLSLKL